MAHIKLQYANKQRAYQLLIGFITDLSIIITITHFFLLVLCNIKLAEYVRKVLKMPVLSSCDCLLAPYRTLYSFLSCLKLHLYCLNTCCSLVYLL